MSCCVLIFVQRFGFFLSFFHNRLIKFIDVNKTRNSILFASPAIELSCKLRKSEVFCLQTVFSTKLILLRMQGQKYPLHTPQGQGRPDCSMARWIWSRISPVIDRPTKDAYFWSAVLWKNGYVGLLNQTSWLVVIILNVLAWEVKPFHDDGTLHVFALDTRASEKVWC